MSLGKGNCINARNSTRPQIRRDHIFANVELRMGSRTAVRRHPPAACARPVTPARLNRPGRRQWRSFPARRDGLAGEAGQSISTTHLRRALPRPLSRAAFDRGGVRHIHTMASPAQIITATPGVATRTSARPQTAQPLHRPRDSFQREPRNRRRDLRQGKRDVADKNRQHRSGHQQLQKWNDQQVCRQGDRSGAMEVESHWQRESKLKNGRHQHQFTEGKRYAEATHQQKCRKAPRQNGLAAA